MTFIEQRMQFLYDMVHYYGSDTSRRAVDSRDGRWNSSACFWKYDGRRDPVGRFIPYEKKPHLLLGYPNKLRMRSEDGHLIVRDVSLSDFVPENIFMLGPNFLTEVCQLHDYDANWYNRGLSTTGQSHLSEIIANYCDEELIVDYEHYF